MNAMPRLLGLVFVAAVVVFLVGSLLPHRSKREAVEVDATDPTIPGSPVNSAIDVPSSERRSGVSTSTSADPRYLEPSGHLLFVDAITRSPLMGVRVEGQFPGFECTHASDSDGIVTLDRSRCLDGRFDCSLAGYCGYAIANGEFERRASGSTYTVQMIPSGTLMVRVRDTAGNPIENVYVQVLPYDRGADAAALREPWVPSFQHPRFPTGPSTPREPRSWTDADGCLTLEGIATERDLIVSVDNAVLPDSQIVRIDGSSRMRTVDFVGRLGVRVEGRLLSVAGLPLTGLGVALIDSAGNRFPHTLAATDSAGRFEILAVSPGWMTVALAALGGTDRRVLIADRPVVDLGDIVMEGSAEVRGVLLLPEGWKQVDPGWLGRLQVSAEHGGMALQVLRLTEKKDSIEFHGRTRPGPIELVVRERGQELARAPALAPSRDSALFPKLTCGAVQATLIGVPAGASVRAIVQSRGAAGWKGRYFARGTGDPTSQLVWENGTLVLRGVPEGESRLTIHALDMGSADIMVTVRAGQLTDVGAMELGYASLVVRVRNSAGDPVAGAYVFCARTGDGPPGQQALTTDVAGMARISKASCGEWRVSAAGWGSPGSTSVVELEPGEHAEVTLDCDCDSTLRIVARDGDKPVRGAVVHLHSIDGEADRLVNRRLLTDLQTNEHGIVECTGLGSGDYYLSVRASLDGFGLVHQKARIRLDRGLRILHMNWSSSGQVIAVQRNGHPFTDLRTGDPPSVRAIGPELELHGRVVDPDQGLVRIPTLERIDYLLVRVASTTGKEKRGTGGEVVCAEVAKLGPGANRIADVCDGELEVQLRPGASFPEMGIHRLAAGYGDPSQTQYIKLLWSDDAGNSRTYRGFPRGASLSAVHYDGSYVLESTVIQTEGTPVVLLPLID